MAAPDSDEAGANSRALRELAERLVLASFGAVALTRDGAGALADELSRRGRIGREEARALVDELGARWRGEATRFGLRAGTSVQAYARDVGLATSDDVQDLALRVAQLEHRLRLLEGGASEVGAARVYP